MTKWNTLLLLLDMVIQQHSMSGSSPEQTASLLSTWLFAYLDKSIFEAMRVEHLPIDKFTSLPDEDTARHLAQAAFPVR